MARIFNAQIGGILKAPPLRLVNGPITIVSMVSLADFPMYLLAVRSFYHAIGRGNIVVLPGDGLIKANVGEPSRWNYAGRSRQAKSDQLARLLRKHIPDIEIVDVGSIPLGPCAAGGTWERLLFLLDRSEKEFVIQLDSDTLTLSSDLSEIEGCVADNRAFVLGGKSAPQEFKSMLASSAEADKSSPLIFDVAESRFEEYPGAETLRYIRGSSAFTGFARGGFQRHQVEAFYRQMETMFGKRWLEWGTEQVGSNFAIANSRNAAVLPYPAYANYEPGFRGDAKFVHFYGTHRYLDGAYARRGRQVIDHLMSPACI